MIDYHSIDIATLVSVSMALTRACKTSILVLKLSYNQRKILRFLKENFPEFEG